MGARCVALAVTGVAALAVVGSASAATIRTPGHINPMVPHGSVNHDTVTSSNWSGYAVQSTGQFTDAKGSWQQPAATCNTNSAQYASFWVGIDGYSSNSVEQLGTDSDCNGRNRPSYYAWYEMYPANSVELSPTQYPVKPGDTLSADVSVTGTNFTLSIVSSEGWTFKTTQPGAGLAQSSAEWIAESPEICSRFRCTLAQLSDFGTVNFTSSAAAVGGAADQPISSFPADSGPHDIIATTSNGTVRAQPSTLAPTGTGFNIAWKHD